MQRLSFPILPVLMIACLARGAADDKPAQSDDSPAGEYIEYRAQPELGRVTVTDCAVRGKKSVEYLTKNAAELAKGGIFPCLDEATKRQIYQRTAKVGDRKIDTLIVVYPPKGKGDDAVPGTQQLVIRVNGRKKVDCTIGTSADGDLWVSEVTVHAEDGTLEIRALTADGEELGVPEEWESLDDPTVITDDSFFEDLPEDGKGKEPEKA